MREYEAEAPVGLRVSLGSRGEDKGTGGVLFPQRSLTAGNSLAIRMLPQNVCVCVCVPETV